jgi:hypothetical protein
MNYFEFVTSEEEYPASSKRYERETERKKAYSKKSMLSQEQQEKKQHSMKSRPQHSCATSINLEQTAPRPTLSKKKRNSMAINQEFAAFWQSERTVATMQMSTLSLDLEISIDGDRSCSSLSSLSSYRSWSSSSVVDHDYNQEGLEREEYNETSSRLLVMERNTNRIRSQNPQEMMVVGDRNSQLPFLNRYSRKAKQIMQHLCKKKGSEFQNRCSCVSLDAVTYAYNAGIISTSTSCRCCCAA